MRTIPVWLALAALAGCHSVDPGDPVETNETIAPTGSAAPAMTTIPAEYLGTWDSDPAACRASTSEMRLTVTPDRLRFYEGSARVAQVAGAGSGTIDVRGVSDSEGVTEERSYRLARTGEGRLSVRVNGSTAERVRCPGDAG